MKLFKSPWFYTVIVFLALWFSPLSRDYGTIVSGWGQKIGLQTGKQLAFFGLVLGILPIVIAFYMFKFALKDLRK